MKRNYVYHYVYRITNIVLNKFYYGSRSTNRIPSEDIGFYYFSSSRDKDFMLDQINNPQNYLYKVVSIFDNKDDALNFEIRLHLKFNVAKNPKFYNKANATSTSFSITGTELSQETKKKMSEARRGRVVSDETKLKLSKSHIGIKHTDETKLKLSKSHIGNKNNLGKKRSEESKKKSSESHKGQIPWNKNKNDIYSEESKRKMSDAKKNMTQEQKDKMYAWKKGKPLPESTKIKLRRPQEKVKCPHCEKIGGISAMKQSHFDNCKWRLDNEK
jgi:hypothetical protein